MKKSKQIDCFLEVPEQVIDIRTNASALESYQVCLKMLFVDLEELNDPRVNEILKHYHFAWVTGGHVGLELPRFRPAKKAKK